MMVASPQCILVAEDEPLTRMLAAEVLPEAGFDVVEARNASEALIVLRAQGGEVVLLFTDRPEFDRLVTYLEASRGRWQ
jgi:CheY-like chemotaxis protein